MHSVASDGELTVEELVAEARAAGLDFLATTEHNAIADRSSWHACAGDDVLVIFGEEVTTEDGHWLALGLPDGQPVDWRYRAEDGAVGREARRVRDAGGLCVVAHPKAPYPTGTFRFDYADFDAVEVWNGLWSSDREWNADNETALADWTRSLDDRSPRSRRTAVGNSDAHLADQIGVPHTVVRAADRTSDAILAGIRGGRCWMASSSRVDLSLHAVTGQQRASIGECVPLARGSIDVRLHVEGVPSGTVTLHTEQGTAFTATLPPDGAGAFSWSPTAEQTAFVRAEVRDRNGQMAALTNPILFSGEC